MTVNQKVLRWFTSLVGIILLGICSLNFCHAQLPQRMWGILYDAELNEPLVGAVVRIPCLQTGAITNSIGRFNLELTVTQACKDTGQVFISLVGYETQVIGLKQFLKVHSSIKLKPASNATAMVEISARKSPREMLKATQMSMNRLDSRELKLIPAFMGEVDLLRAMQLKPGVQNGGEATNGFYVRGGTNDQNLILIDDAPVYNPNHLFGFFSIFNNDAISGAELYKGGFPAQYGGRLSSVIDVHTRQANTDSTVIQGGIGAIASRLTLETPIIKDKVGLMMSGRRTYFDVFTRMANKAQADQPNFEPIPDYFFYDYNFKAHWQVNPRDKLILSGYYGRDQFSFERNRFAFGFEWGNQLINLQYTSQVSPKLFATHSAHFSGYDYRLRNQFSNLDFSLSSGIKTYTLKSDYIYNPTDRHLILYGGSVSSHNFNLGRASGGSTDNLVNFNTGTQLGAYEYGLYLSDDWRINERWQLYSGLRLSSFAFGGTNYFGLEPRFSARYLLSEDWSIKASAARMFQYLHLVVSSGVSLPTDLWYPSGDAVKPQISDQFAFGVQHALNHNWSLSVETYTKYMDRQIDFKDGANLFVNNNLDTVFVFGRGWTQGVEVYLEKTEGRFTGWLGYTLSWNWRQFDAINQGRPFHPRNDRRHDIQAVGMYRINDRLTLSATWVYGTGNAITLPQGRFAFQDVPGTTQTPPGFLVAPQVTERNSFRMEPYHRMDLGLVWNLKPKWGIADLTFSLYNVYNRANPFFIYFETLTSEPNGTGNVTGFQARQVSLFPIIPAATFNFRY